MKYDDNRSSLDLLKKMFVKFNSLGDNVQVGKNQIKRIMEDTYAILSEEQRNEYREWQEVQILILQMKKEKAERENSN